MEKDMQKVLKKWSESNCTYKQRLIILVMNVIVYFHTGIAQMFILTFF